VQYSNCYDIYFDRFTREIFQAILPWCWMKAMGIVESGLNPVATSSAGAAGVMQLMPGTAADMVKRTGISCSKDTVLAPHINIYLGIAYARHCYNIWGDEYGLERIRFMLGSYNAGPGHIIDAQIIAQRKGLPTDQWQSIVATLPDVTGMNATETINYVNRVEKTFKRLLIGK
jgi:soluble lytic murein transglycosylase-like protein